MMKHKLHKTWLIAAALAVVAALVAGCYPPALGGPIETVAPPTAAAPTGEAPTGAPGLPVGDWQLVSAGGEPMPDTTAHFMIAADGTVTGSGGCNRISGSVALSDAGLKFSPLARTEMFCEGKMDQEQALLDALALTAGFTQTADGLTLLDAAGQPVATFIPRLSASLTGSGWVATMINDGKGGVVSVAGGPADAVTAVFGADGRLSGKGGCNSYGAEYTVDGDQLTIGQAISTLMACADADVMAQETAYYQALSRAATFRIDGDTLEIRDADGALLVSFEQAKG